MTRKDEAQILDQLEDACARAEKAGKDEDLLIALRAVYILWREKIREEGQKDGFLRVSGIKDK